MSNVKRNSNFRKLRNIMGILFVLSVVAFGNVIGQYKQMQSNNERIHERVTIMPTEGLNKKEKLPIVDFEALSEINESCVGWIYACEGQISYPIVAARDDFYLSHSIDGITSRAGSILVDSEESNPFTLKRAVLYGHNMKDGSMFHPLLQYWQKEGYLSQHPYVFVITEEEIYQYEISDVYVMECEKISFEPFPEQSAQAVIDLITCEYSGKNTRLVVEARRNITYSF